jgi:hypothetical protein
VSILKMESDKEIIQEAAFAPDNQELGLIKPIRTETVLSRLPMHNLAKKGNVDIRIVKRGPDGKITLQWEISHSERYGRPRAIAYKLDTLVINRRIDESPKPLPKMICLGSLREIAEELGLGGDTNSVRRAMRQNAFLGITAKLTYPGANGGERLLEADFTRYSAIFTGEKLPDGRRADAVYIILNEPYREVLNNAPARPLNYEYMKVLTPAAQRFYEVVSYRVFAALKSRTQEAKILYSEYCMSSAQQRYFDYDHFKKQMWKIHHPHLQSGYLKASRYTATTDAEGNPDWMMIYVPGPKAQAEHRAFSARKGQEALFGAAPNAVAEIGEWRAEPRGRAKAAAVPPPARTEALELVRYFHRRARGVESYVLPPGSREAAQAEELVKTHGLEATRFAIDYAIRQAEKTNFSMRVFGALIQYVPDAIASFEKRKSAAAEADGRERSEADNKRKYDDWYKRGRQALEALAPEKREALEADVKTEFATRWPRSPERGESQFFKRMIESAMIAKIIGAGPSSANPSAGQVQLS